MSTNSEAKAAKVSKLAVPLLGFLSAIQTVDPSVASTALIGASRGLHMTTDEMALASSIATLAVAATIISTGLIADKLGRRRVLLWALVVGAIGDVIVFLAPVTAVYMTGRVIAGIGLGAVYGAAFAYIRAVTPPDRIPGAMGIFAAVGGATVLVFTFMGGVLVGIDWRIAFLLITFMSLISIPLVLKILPPVPIVPMGKVEVTGQILLAGGVIGLLYGISRLNHGIDPSTVIPLTLGFVLLGLFYWWENRSENRFFPVDLLKNPIFLAAICTGFVYNFGMAVGFLQLTNLWQYVNQLPPATVAAWQIPFSLSGIIAAVILGKLMLKGLSNASVILLGGIITAVGFLYLAFAHGSHSLLGFLPGLLIVGVGVMAASLPYGNLIIGQAPPRYFGPVTSSRTTIGQFFYSAGFAFSTIMISSMTLDKTAKALANSDGSTPDQVQQGLDAVNSYAMFGAKPQTDIGHTALVEAGSAYGSSFAIFMVGTAIISVVVAFIGWLLITRATKKQNEPEAVLEGESA